jgi:glucose-1-phosphate cytidylyltransferase
VKVVLFCGGLGMRIREHAQSAPKPMAMIGDRPLLWHVMRYYAHFGLTDFVLCLGYGASAVKEFFLRYDETRTNDFRLTGGRDVHLFASDIAEWRITFVDTGLRASVGERLMRVRRHVETDDLFVANYADTLTDAHLPTLIERFRRGTATAALLAVPLFSSHHVVRIGTADRVAGIRTVPELGQWANGGYFVLRPEIFDVLREGEDLVPHALNRLIPAGRLTANVHTGFWRSIDTAKDRTEVEEMYHREDAPWMLWDGRRRRADSTTALGDAVSA